MDQQTRDSVTWTLGTLTTLLVLGAMVVRFVLLPWLRDHLVAPVRETHRQVAENGHANRIHPTIPDRLEDLGSKVDSATADHATQAGAITALTRVLDEHLRASERWMDLYDRELDLVKQRLHLNENGD